MFGIGENGFCFFSQSEVGKLMVFSRCCEVELGAGFLTLHSGFLGMFLKTSTSQDSPTQLLLSLGWCLCCLPVALHSCSPPCPLHPACPSYALSKSNLCCITIQPLFIPQICVECHVREGEVGQFLGVEKVRVGPYEWDLRSCGM